MLFRLIFATSVLIAAPAYSASIAPVSASQASIVKAFSHVLPDVHGKSITGLVVTYKPGESTPAHRHGSAFVVAYVLTGSIRSAVNGGASKVYSAGESWSEAPGAHHTVSANASKTLPASLLAIFISDNDDPAPVVIDKP